MPHAYHLSGRGDIGTVTREGTYTTFLPLMILNNTAMIAITRSR